MPGRSRCCRWATDCCGLVLTVDCRPGRGRGRAGRRRLSGPGPAALRLAPGPPASSRQALRVSHPAGGLAATRRAARGAGRQRRADRASDRRAGFQSGPARCADPGRDDRGDPAIPAMPPCCALRRAPRARSRGHDGHEPRPGATGLPAAAAAGAAALAGTAGLHRLPPLREHWSAAAWAFAASRRARCWRRCHERVPT